MFGRARKVLIRASEVRYAIRSYRTDRRVRAVGIRFFGSMCLACVAPESIAPGAPDRTRHGSALWPHAGDTDDPAIACLPVWALSHHALCCQHRRTPTSPGRHFTDNAGIEPRGA